MKKILLILLLFLIPAICYAAIGYNGDVSDSASFAHLDNNSANSYALRQNSGFENWYEISRSNN